MEMLPPKIVEILRAAAILIAAALIGNWFVSEFKKARIKGLPLYKVYFTAPGILIMVAMAIPVVIWLIRQ